jgi:hypothetical protein
MDTTTILTIIGIVVAIIIIGIWQIQLARKQIHISKSQARNLAKPLMTAVKETKTDESEYREQPYPGEIFNITNQLPLIQRHEARNKYAGVKVKWRGTIQNLYLDGNNLVALMIRVDDHGTFTYVRCKVKISEYPEVKIAKDGHGIWVYGEIKEVGNTDIELTKCKIKID